MDTKQLKVGQKVLYVPSKRIASRSPYWLTVAKVGRKWVEFEESSKVRLELETGQSEVNAYGHRGSFYLSEAEYQAVEAEQQRQSVAQDDWERFRRALSAKYQTPVDSETIRKCAELLNINLDGK